MLQWDAYNRDRSLKCQICETAVFTSPGGGGSSPCFCLDSVHLNFAGTTSGKQGQQFLYKLMPQDKDRSPLQMNSTRQGQQSIANEYH